MRLRPVSLDDVGAYVAMRCDPVMMAELGGPQDPALMPGLVARDVARTASGERWILMILTDDGEVAGTVTLYQHDGVSEIGWMVLPPFQGRGLARAAAGQMLNLAAAVQRWGEIHAWPPITNAASNAVCRALGFRRVGEEETTFGGRVFRTNHWVRTDPSEEVLDVVDLDDVVVGQARRADVYAQGLRHRAVFVLVRDSRDRIFVHRRTESKLIFPGRYDMFVGGVVGAGESYDDAAHREASEELGVDDLPTPAFLFRFLYVGTAGTWFSAVYAVHRDPPVRPQAEEVAWHAFITEAELDARLDEWPWVPDGLEAYRRLRS